MNTAKSFLMAPKYFLFGQRLKAIRTEKGLKQSDLSESLGTDFRSVSNWERGVSAPNLDLLVKLADILDVSLDYLAGRKDDPA